MTVSPGTLPTNPPHGPAPDPATGYGITFDVPTLRQLRADRMARVYRRRRVLALLVLIALIAALIVLAFALPAVGQSGASTGLTFWLISILTITACVVTAYERNRP